MQREDDAFFERLGKAIRVERTRQGLRQDDLAEAAGLSKPYVSHIEVGRRHPSMDAVTAIARALGLSVGQLMAASEPGQGPALVAVSNRWLRRRAEREKAASGGGVAPGEDAPRP